MYIYIYICYINIYTYIYICLSAFLNEWMSESWLVLAGAILSCQQKRN